MKKSVLNLDKLHLILIGVILLGVIIFLVSRENTPPLNLTNPYQSQLDSLSRDIKMYEDENSKLNEKYLESIEMSNKYQSQIDSLNTTIISQRKSHEKKIKSINNYTSTELYMFIADRYQ